MDRPWQHAQQTRRPGQAAGPYIADFVCLERCLIVEVDGGHHTEEAQVASDARRDRWLNAEGYRVLRLPANDIFHNFAGVVDTVWAALQEVRDVNAGDTPTRRAG